MDHERINGAMEQMPAAYALLGSGLVLYLMTVAWYRVREFRYLASRISFEGMKFTSNLGLGRVAWIYISYLITAAVVGLAMVVGITLMAFVLNGIALDPDAIGSGPADIFGGLDENAKFVVVFGIVMVVAVLLQTLGRVMVFHRLARAVVTSLAITGTQNFEQVGQALDSAPRFGEGLADAFDLGDF